MFADTDNERADKRLNECRTKPAMRPAKNR